MDADKSRVFLMPDGRRLEVDADDVDYIYYRSMRPRLMNYEDFVEIRRILKKELAHYLEGKIVHLSRVSDLSWKEYTEGKKIKQRGKTYRKKHDDDK